MLAASPWVEHFNDFEAEEFQPLLDPQDPVEHYYQVRELFSLGRFEKVLSAPMGRKFPPTVVLRSLASKESVPLFLEWPEGIFPSVAVQCQFAMLLALAGEKEAAKKLAERLAPIVLGGFWTLWTLEKDYREEETRISCALFLRAIGKEVEADALYSSNLPKSPFFSFLYQKQIRIEVVSKPPGNIAWSLNGSKAGVGAMRMGSVRFFSFGPHAHPLSNSNLFGIAESQGQWFCSSAQKDVWFQVEPNEGTSFSLHSLGVSFEKPMAFVFYVGAEECRIGDRLFKPKSLHRFLGEASAVQFDGVTVEVDRPLKIELIPLANSQSYWGAGFLLAFWLSPLSTKVFFRIN